MKAELFTEAGNEPWRMSRHAFLAVCLFGFIETVLEFLAWREGVKMGNVFWVELVTLPALSIVVSYVAAMSMISRATTVAGLLRFALGFLGMNTLSIIGGAAILLAPSGPAHDPVIFSALAIMTLGFFASAFLPAWPLAQALSPRLIQPKRLFGATQGERWSFFLFAFVIGSIDKMVPSTKGVRDIGLALLYAACSGLAGALTIVAVVAFGVAAWRYGCKVDPELRGDAVPLEGMSVG